MTPENTPEEQRPELQEEQSKKPFWKRYRKLLAAVVFCIAAVNLYSFLKNAPISNSIPANLTGMPAKPQQTTGTPSDRAPSPVTRVEVADAPALKEALQKKGNLEILVTADIDAPDNGDNAVWCLVEGGYKCLDLNGHSILIRNDWAQYSTLMRIGVGTELVIWDSRNRGGKICYDGRIDEEATLRVRDLFEVYGRLVVNGGRLEAGREKTKDNAAFRDQTINQITGSAVRVKKDGVLVVNGGCLIGRGRGECAMLAEDGGSMVFNNGLAYGYGQAQCSEGEIYVASGRFTVSASERPLQNGAESLSPEYVPWVGLREDQIAAQALYERPIGRDTTDLAVGIGAGRCELVAESGETVQNESGDSILQIMSQTPFVSVVTQEPYFRGIEDRNYPELDYRLRYRWQILHSGKVVSETEEREDFTRINLMSAFPGFTPSLGEPYTVRCTATEQLKPGLVYERSFVDTPFVLTQSVKAPFLTNDLWDQSYFQPGSSLTISVGAAGTKLNYQWQELSADGVWQQLPTQTAPGLVLENLTDADVGRRFRCQISNTEGDILSSETMLALMQEEIDYISLTGIDPPVHGVLLDESAEVLTPGCRVTAVSWKPLGKHRVEHGFRPYAGLKMVVAITVQREQDAVYAEKLKGDLDGLEWMSISVKDNLNCTLEFCFTTAPPEVPEEIDLIRLSCAPPEDGAVCGSIEAVSMGYGDGTTPDVRYSSFGNTEWEEDGDPMQLMKDSFETDCIYTVNTDLRSNTGWVFTDATVAELNGEQMDSQLLPNGTLSCSYRYDMTRENDEMTESFVDVKEKDYFYEAVIWAVNHEPQVTTGTDRLHFSPKNNCTYGQVITFLWRALGCPQPSSTSELFPEGKQKSFYNQALRWAAENNVTGDAAVNGVNPEDYCTRAEYITFLWNALGKPEPRSLDRPFVDLNTQAPYYEAVCWALENEVTMGSGDARFQPDEVCTRGQVVTFLYRAMKGQLELTAQPEDITVPFGKGVPLRMEFKGNRGVCTCCWEEYTPDGVWLTRTSTRTTGTSDSWNFGPGKTTVLRPVVTDSGGTRIIGRPFAVIISGRSTQWMKLLTLSADLPAAPLRIPADGEALTLRCVAEGGSACYDYFWFRISEYGKTEMPVRKFTGMENCCLNDCAYITQPGTYVCLIRDRLTGQTLSTQEATVRSIGQ